MSESAVNMGDTSAASGGPLAGVRVLEFASIGPGPFCCMLLSDMGAEVLRIDRPGGVGGTGPNPALQRGRPSLVLDLKDSEDRQTALTASRHADVVVEGNRPGVMERLGLGPEDLMPKNKGLIYARMTGYGQEGPDSLTAGHDLNYLAATGALDAISKPGEPPRPPLNLLADFGGGALYLAFGIAAALYERQLSGQGQIVDAAIVDGTAHLMNMVAGARHSGALKAAYDENILSGAAPFYRSYVCADGRFIAVGAIEDKFYRKFLEAMGEGEFLSLPQRDNAHWPELNARLEQKFAAKTAKEWMSELAPLDSCINEVLSLEEAVASAPSRARNMFPSIGGLHQGAPAPRFSRTPGHIKGPAAAPGEGGSKILEKWLSIASQNPQE